jgi:hypothetical protein
LSEKALENKRQAEEKERQSDDTMDLAQASQAIAAVEYAMEHLQDYQMEERKARTAQAALARLQRQQNENGNTSPWALKTPSEPDRDELRECIETSMPAIKSTTPSAAMTMWITKLMKECHIHNWRELANVIDASDVANKLGIPEENVYGWIDRAQDESLGEIIVEICDGNLEAVEVLTERGRSGTPKDLAAWRSIPDLLLEQIRQPMAPGHSPANGNDLTREPNWMNEVTISTWCERAHQLLQDYEWLNWYATPVE